MTRAGEAASGAARPVTRVPHRLEPFGEIGWTVAEFRSAADAAAFVAAHPQAAMPCWRRFEVVAGALVLAR